MKKVTIDFEFVQEAHEAACSEWKKRIEAHVPELRRSEKGWYKSRKDPDWMAYFNGKRFEYGFNIYGDWFVSDKYKTGKVTDYMEAATRHEVQCKLEEEAKRRGLLVGSDVSNQIVGNDKTEIRGYYFNSNFQTLYGAGEGYGGPFLFREGVWNDVEKLKDNTWYESKGNPGLYILYNQEGDSYGIAWGIFTENIDCTHPSVWRRVKNQDTLIRLQKQAAVGKAKKKLETLMEEVDMIKKGLESIK